MLIDNICVVETAMGSCNGDPIEANPGDWKFNLYGYVEGAGYGSFAAAYHSFGIRTSIDITQMGADVEV